MSWSLRTMLDLAAFHLPWHVYCELNSFDGVVAYQITYGWMLWVPNDPLCHAADYEDDIPLEILAVQLVAREHGADYVMLDLDGEPYEGLPTWAW